MNAQGKGRQGYKQAVPAVLDPVRPLDQGASLVHEGNPEGNLLLKVIETGKGEAAFEECQETVEASFRVPHQEHSYLETEAGWALLKNGVLETTASTQSP